MWSSLVMLAVLSQLSVLGTSAAVVASGCKITDKPIDALWLLDESGSVGKANYKKLRDTVVDFVTGTDKGKHRFKLGDVNDASRFGVMEFGQGAFPDKGHEFLPLEKCKSDSQCRHYFKTTVEGFDYNGYYTATGSALKQVVHYFNGKWGFQPRKGVAKYVFIATDGNPKAPKKDDSLKQKDWAQKAAKELLGMGVNIVYIPIAPAKGKPRPDPFLFGGKPDKDYSKPGDANTFQDGFLVIPQEGGFDKLGDLLKNLMKKRMCPPPPEPTAKPSATPTATPTKEPTPRPTKMKIPPKRKTKSPTQMRTPPPPTPKPTLNPLDIPKRLTCEQIFQQQCGVAKAFQKNCMRLKGKKAKKCKVERSNFLMCYSKLGDSVQKQCPVKDYTPAKPGKKSECSCTGICKVWGDPHVSTFAGPEYKTKKAGKVVLYKAPGMLVEGTIKQLSSQPKREYLVDVSYNGKVVLDVSDCSNVKKRKKNVNFGDADALYNGVDSTLKGYARCAVERVKGQEIVHVNVYMANTLVLSKSLFTSSRGQFQPNFVKASQMIPAKGVCMSTKGRAKKTNWECKC